LIRPDLAGDDSSAAVEKEPKRLFVYGSLMKGFFNHEKSLEGKVLSCIPGKVHGILYHQSLKGYPAMVKGEGWVKGELLELDEFDRLILLCDRLEGFIGPGNSSNEYERLVSPVKLENGDETSAQVYWYVRHDLGSPDNPAIPVPSGDWRVFMQKP